jgi:Mor family transcriptional regulator
MTSSKTLITEDLKARVAQDFQAKYGDSPAEASSRAFTAIESVLEHLVGNQVYFPRAALLQHRNAEIYSRANGCNTAHLAAEYEVTPRHIHRIVRQVRGRKGKP